ncbi:hypothetical protein [Thermanaeromonas sp. C210]|uniref:hypothetical protein n=1 Tax=Thermanaeromonas sp. C210 TaxID=2731925 RepID=UPI00155C34D1|nr:hypothetical protein [Thermanaeromonas sp. C210]GFN23705.1 hypothetical protein TAMC210_20220 [Thermanaeromonas sp. C210]
MDRIKTALEIALERAAAVKVDPEKLLEIENLSQGKVLGARFLSDQELNLKEELLKIQPEVRPHVLKGLEETFLNNLRLPRDGDTMNTNRRCMDGLLQIKKNRSLLKQVFKEIEMLFQYYARSLEQAYLNLKEDFAVKVAQGARAMNLPMGGRTGINVEHMPEFQEEWLRLRDQLASQYEKVLEEKRQQIRGID